MKNKVIEWCVILYHNNNDSHNTILEICDTYTKAKNVYKKYLSNDAISRINGELGISKRTTINERLI